MSLWMENLRVGKLVSAPFFVGFATSVKIEFVFLTASALASLTAISVMIKR